MLYVSTRNKTDSFTAYRALHEQRTPDGGLFVPFRLPVFTKDEIRSFQNKSFGECVAQILNLFFSAGLTGWDVEFLIGRRPIRISTMPHRLIVCELWHNVDLAYDYAERALYHKMCGNTEEQPTDWARIAIRIAVLFGLYAELSTNGIREGDIAVTAGDFSVPMAVWYARKMGLPFGTIICGCNENSAVWDLVHRGEFSTGAAVVYTDLPALDHACPGSIERLIYSTLGLKEAQRYAAVCAKRGIYTLDDETLRTVNNGIVSAVVSGRRTQSVIASIYRTNGYIADGYTAVAYGSLQDYRASTGESRTTLLIADTSPVHSEQSVSRILDITRDELRKKL